jgi:hypothetical protein
MEIHLSCICQTLILPKSSRAGVFGFRALVRHGNSAEGLHMQNPTSEQQEGTTFWDQEVATQVWPA